MKPSPELVNLIKQSEGFGKIRQDGFVEAYPDPVKGWSLPTIGWGTTGKDVRRGTIWTVSDCDFALRKHVLYVAKEVERLLEGAPTTQGQFDALVDFAYNLGVGNLSSSTLLGLHKRSKYSQARAEFGRWIRAGNKVLRGLVARRAKEADMYDS